MYIYEYICEEQWPKQMQRASFWPRTQKPKRCLSFVGRIYEAAMNVENQNNSSAFNCK